MKKLIAIIFLILALTTDLYASDLRPGGIFAVSGTPNTLAKFLNSFSIGDSNLSDNGFGVTSIVPVYVNGVANSVLTGSINPTASADVLGVNTLFLSELKVGDRILVTGLTRTVIAIADDTHLTVDIAFTDVANDTTPERLASSFIVYDLNGLPNFMIHSDGSPYFRSGVPDSATAVAGEMDTAFALTTNGASLFQFKNDEVLKLDIKKDGNVVSNIVLVSPTASLYNYDMTSTITGTLPAGEWYGARGNVTYASPTGNSNANSILGGLKSATTYNPGTNNFSLAKMRGLASLITVIGQAGGTASVTDLRGVDLNATTLGVNIGTYYGIFHTATFTLTAVTTYEGIHLSAAPTATNKKGIYLNGTGLGNDIVFGTTSKSGNIYHDNTDFIINPKLTGSGALKITGDVNIDSNNISNINSAVATSVTVTNLKTTYGSMYANMSSETTTISATDTYTKIIGGMSDGGSSAGFTFQNSDELLCNVAGKYIATWSMSINTNVVSQELEGAVMVNSTAQLNTSSHNTTSAGASKNAVVAGSGVITLAINDVVGLAVANHSAATDIVMEHANLTLNRVDN